MNIKGDNYKVHFDGKRTLTMSGKLAAMPEEYDKIEDFFEKVLNEIKEMPKADTGSSELILDIQELTFLNSSGIKTICVSLVMEADDVEGLRLNILCRNSLTWQVETIPTFKDLMDNLKIDFK